jgi:hypothetical protein
MVGERTPYALEARIVYAWLRPRVEVYVYALPRCMMTVVDAGVLEAAGWMRRITAEGMRVPPHALGGQPPPLPS